MRNRVRRCILSIVIHPAMELEVNRSLQLSLVPFHCFRVREVNLRHIEVSATQKICTYIKHKIPKFGSMRYYWGYLPSCNIAVVVWPAIFGLEQIFIGYCLTVELCVTSVQHCIKVARVLWSMHACKQLVNDPKWLQCHTMYTFMPKLSNFSFSAYKKHIVNCHTS